MAVLLTGLLTGLALVVAIGAQSIFVLRSAARRERIWLIVTICLLSDTALMIAGTAGVAVVAQRLPWLLAILTWAGVAYLVGFAVMSAKSALFPKAVEMPEDVDKPADSQMTVTTGTLPIINGKPGSGTVDTQDVVRTTVTVTPRRMSLWATILATLSVSAINPHAWLDTLVLLGTLANSHGADRWFFVAGAALASAVWLVILAAGGRALANVLKSQKVWRIIDGCVAVVMLGIATWVAIG